MGKLVPFQRPVARREGPYFCGAPMGAYGRFKGSPEAPAKAAPKSPPDEPLQEKGEGA
jgi:hypothetical protein